MGQAPSIAKLPPEWEALLPNINREDILKSAKRVKISKAKDRTIYLDGEEFDLDDRLDVALAILRDFPHLKDVRFKLVPGRLTEERFWGAIFLHLGETVEADRVIENTVGKLEIIEEIKINNDDGPAESNNTDDSNNINVEQDIPPFYLEEFKVQEEHIHRLQRSLREANQKIRTLGLELHKERKKRHAEGVERDSSFQNGQGADGENNEDILQHRDSIGSCPRCNSFLAPPKRQHKGEWVMHEDCREFLKLDDHLKDNLRKEKEKRISEVMAQMKFILDSDSIADSYGFWNCCKREEYSSEGCS